jgi:ferritin
MIQAQEERDHALLFMKYMQVNGLKVTLEAIGKPDKTFETVLDPLEVAAEHERYVTALINAIYHEAHQAKDYRTMKFLDWFVDEQMEEEENADSMISRYKLFGQDPRGLYLLDQEYAGRVYTAPSLTL